MATLAIFRPRRMARWKNLLRHSGWLRTELLHLAVIAALAPHPVQMHRQLPRHGYFGDLPSAPHGQMEELAAPLRLAAHRTSAFGRNRSPGATSSTDAPPASAPWLLWRSSVRAAWPDGRTCCATPAGCAPNFCIWP